MPALAMAQTPQWVNDTYRSTNYSGAQYLTGFAVNEGSNTESFTKNLKAAAKAELIEGIQVSVQSAKTNQKSENNGNFSEDFTATTRTFADADITGLKMEYYYDNAKKMGYAFAYANKSEVKGFYTANISFGIQKIESAISSAQQLEESNNKGKAKKTYEEALPLFKEVQFAQQLLIAIGSDEASVQTEKSLRLKEEIIKSITRMQSAIVVYIKSDEKNFTQKVSLLEPKLKAFLSQRGCSYTTTPESADWLLTIEASTRQGREVDEIFFSYLDVIISLVERKTGKEIYGNNFTDLKGGGLDYLTAGRKAYDASLQKIVDEIAKVLEK
ncbi:hypothetical protein AGMMS49965_11270 [Bacteroidia bacterium]|nr:hypothetical protein AGMMS49965_11270 [Bacteroidia bacterium]